MTTDTANNNASSDTSNNSCNLNRQAPKLVLATWCIVLLTALLLQGISKNATVAKCIDWIVTGGVGLLYPMIVLGFLQLRFRRVIRNHDTNATEQQPELSAADLEASTNKKEDNREPCPSPHHQLSSPPFSQQLPRRRRLYFLDNIKSVLTMIVVSHHVSCAFGACSAYGFPVIIGYYEDSVFHRVLRWTNILDQAYFMSLFFFISAYFSPSSFDRKGFWEFHRDKAKRLSLPLIGVTLTIWPFTGFVAQALKQGETIKYRPGPGQAWFLSWLLVFNLVYSTIRETTKWKEHEEGENNETYVPVKFPGTIKRVLAGIFICGWIMGALMFLMADTSDFAFMDIETVGSLPCHIFLFFLGTCAQRNDWLKNPLPEQLDLPVWLLRIGVVLEGGIIIFLYDWVDPEDNADDPWNALFISVAGMYCLDMCLAVVELFYSYCTYVMATFIITLLAFSNALLCCVCVFSMQLMFPIV